MIFPNFYLNRELSSLVKAQYCQFLGFLTQFRFKENLGGEISNSGIWEIWIWNFLYSYFQPGGSSVYFFWDEKHQKHQPKQRGFKWQKAPKTHPHHYCHRKNLPTIVGVMIQMIKVWAKQSLSRLLIKVLVKWGW